MKYENDGLYFVLFIIILSVLFYYLLLEVLMRSIVLNGWFCVVVPFWPSLLTQFALMNLSIAIRVRDIPIFCSMAYGFHYILESYWEIGLVQNNKPLTFSLPPHFFHAHLHHALFFFPIT